MNTLTLKSQILKNALGIACIGLIAGLFISNRETIGEFRNSLELASKRVTTAFFLAPYDQLDDVQNATYCNKKYTLKQIMERMVKNKLTEKEMTQFAHDLLQQRINYWKKKSTYASWLHKHEVPIYIQLKPDITPQEMLKSCKLVKRTEKTKYFMGVTDHFYHGESIVRMRESFRQQPVIFLITLLHELTHVEQAANADLLGAAHPQLEPILSQFPFLTNKAAYEIYTSGVIPKNHIDTMVVQVETEADTHCIIFCPNPLLAMKGFAGHINVTSDQVERGYLSNKAVDSGCCKRMHEYYMRYPSRFAKDSQECSFLKDDNQ